MIGRSGERGSRISVLATRHDEDDEVTKKFRPSFLAIFLEFKRIRYQNKHFFSSDSIQLQIYCVLLCIVLTCI